MTQTTKSTTCTGKHGPLTVFFSPSQARAAALYEKERRGHDLDQYMCHTCRRWHLRPRKHKTNTCGCTDRYGDRKPLYASKAEAERAKEGAYKKHGAHLYMYPCPHGQGWHLSSTTAGY